MACIPNGRSGTPTFCKPWPELVEDRINQRVEVDKDDAETVAAEFLSEQGLN